MESVDDTAIPSTDGDRPLNRLRSDDPLHPGAAAAAAVGAFALSVARTAMLLARRQIHNDHRNRNRIVVFADGTRSRVYRETLISGRRPAAPALLVVGFRLRGFGRNPALHALFRLESVLNTPLFAGFAGFRSKLWLTDTQTGNYHGIYEWDGADRAISYADTLCSLLRLVSVPGSVRYHVVDGTTPEAVLADPALLGPLPDDPARWWWRPAPADTSSGAIAGFSETGDSEPGDSEPGDSEPGGGDGGR